MSDFQENEYEQQPTIRLAPYRTPVPDWSEQPASDDLMPIAILNRIKAKGANDANDDPPSS